MRSARAPLGFGGTEPSVSRAAGNLPEQPKGQVTDYVTWPLWSRLRDSNPRPTHYEVLQDRDEQCSVIRIGPVSPGQSMCAVMRGAARDGSCRTIRSRIAHADRGFDQYTYRPQ